MKKYIIEEEINGGEYVNEHIIKCKHLDQLTYRKIMINNEVEIVFDERINVRKID